VLKPAAGGTHHVAAGETLFSLGRTYGVSPYAIADLNGLPHGATLKLGQEIRIPAGAQAAAKTKPVAPAAASPGTEEIADAAPAAAAPEVQAQQPSPPPAVVAEAPVEAPVDTAPAGMRWPVRGKVISAFGAKPNGLKNEGINIAVPEGTSIRAAENGVVAYAGNELKGYGNLVLIRHDGGVVTAYAHAKELFVKRGDTVKRGDVIAKAGQTGSVSSPQLHFEVRKGATALDPMQFLSASTAAN
jgi:murein DD-endopeptidase MepM/ murein hydrolase activator NlpD